MHANRPTMTPTDQLVVRRATAGDAGAIAAFHARGAAFFAPFEPVRPHGALEEPAVLGALVAEEQPDAARTIIAVDPTSGEVVGRIRISNLARGPFQSATLGYGVAERWNGRGIAQRLVRRAVDEAFRELRLHRIEAGTLVDNVASQHVLERCGFTRIGLSPRHLQIAGQWRDHVLYSAICGQATPGGPGQNLR